MKQIMNKLREIRLQVANFMSKFDAYLVPLGKFILAMVAFCVINSKFGFMGKAAKFPIALILALFCSFMPMNMIVIIGALLTLLHAYALSMECAIVLFVVYVIMFLLYFRFSPKDTIAAVLTPICFAFKIPYVIPMSCGLIGTPASAVSVACGTVIYFVLGTLIRAKDAFTEAGSDDIVDNLKAILEALLKNREMMVCAAAFGCTVLIVYIVRRMSIKYSWTIAMIVGALSNMFIILIGDVIYNTQISIVGLIFGTILACIVVKIIQFLVFDVDYSRTEKVQFEDDDYYYYVKAVPKIRARGEKKSESSKNHKRVRRVEEDEDDDEEEVNETSVREKQSDNRPSEKRVRRAVEESSEKETVEERRPRRQISSEAVPERKRVAEEERVLKENTERPVRMARENQRAVSMPQEEIVSEIAEPEVVRKPERTQRSRTEDEQRLAADMAQRRARRESQTRNSEERQAEINRRREEQRRELREAQARRMQERSSEIVQTENDDLGMSRRAAYQRRKMEERER